MVFASRQEAGDRLGRLLKDAGWLGGAVLGLPRGGVIVADRVARCLGWPLGVVNVRKIGHPRHREFAVGALAENDVLLLDSSALESKSVIWAELDDVIQEEKIRLRQNQSRFHLGAPLELAGRTVLVVDDGLATGATAEAAVVAGRKQAPLRIIMAVPVASARAIARLETVAGTVRALH